VGSKEVAVADNSNLKRELQSMPDEVKQALLQNGLMDRYNERPAYQRNDYLSWIARAKRDSTRQKRLQQMLDELAAGGVYMNMPHRPSA
jgi:uncharacterized protein YdeI (YjbR/CyaY-like superfamily)